jgi:Nucleotidyltransferase domain
MSAVSFVRELVDELRRAHRAHTIILYGSHARGDANAESDIDVAAFADIDAPIQDARMWRGTFLDAFIYPSARAELPTVDLLRLCDGVILLDEHGLATPLLDALAALHKRGPPPIDDAGARRVWAKKMVARAPRRRRGGLPSTLAVVSVARRPLRISRRLVSRTQTRARGSRARGASDLRGLRARARFVSEHRRRRRLGRHRHSRGSNASAVVTGS